MKRCKTCKFWDLEYASPGWGYCVMAGSSWGKPVEPDSLAVSEDSEGYSSSLQTKPNFGCVQ